MQQEVLQYPHSDNTLQYDYNRHRYILTEDVFLQELGINFNDIPAGTDANPSDRAMRFSKKVSEEVYRYLTKDSMNASWLSYELATVPGLRPVIAEMLIAQAEYNFNSGFSDSFSGVDMYRGKVIDREALKEACICPTVEDYAYQIQPCIGRCLKYAGYFGGIAPPYTDKDGNAIW